MVGSPLATPPRRRGLTISIYLPDGTSDGVKIVKRMGWTGIGIMCSRAQYVHSRNRPEFQRTGVYVLSWPSSEERDRLAIYIGEANLLRDRLDYHLKDKEEWTHVVAFTTEDGSIHKTHAKLLESKLVQLARSARRADLENSGSNEPLLPESERDYVESFLDEMLVVYPLLGIRAFEPAEAGPVAQAGAKVGAFFIKMAGFEARGQERPDGFVVLKGSHAKKTHAPTQSPSNRSLWDELVSTGILVDRGTFLEFTESYVFNSSSQAGGVVLGRRVAGPQIWKDAQGCSIKDLELAALASSEPIESSSKFSRAKSSRALMKEDPSVGKQPRRLRSARKVG